MPTPVAFRAPFHPNQYYHLMFRSIDGISLFHNEIQRSFFLEKFHRFTNMMFNWWAYSLLDNHSHIIIKVKSVEEVIAAVQLIEEQEKTLSMKRFLENPDSNLLNAATERQINSFMVSYTNTMNNFTERKGGLFQQPFRRSLIAEESHLQQAIVYTHANAQKHALVDIFLKHLHNSYHAIVTGTSSFIDVSSVLLFFGGKEKFIASHKETVDYFYKNQWPNSKLERD